VIGFAGEGEQAGDEYVRRIGFGLEDIIQWCRLIKGEGQYIQYIHVLQLIYIAVNGLFVLSAG
jgi:hypothetical protein